MRLRWGVGVLVVLVAASFANAAIIGWECADDKDGAVTMGQMGWYLPGTTADAYPQKYRDRVQSGGIEAADYSLIIPEIMHSYPAHIEGDFTTDTPLDPTVWILKEVANGTLDPWIGYKMNIYMMQPFTIPAASAPVPGWSYTITPVGAQGTYMDSHSHTWNYMGVVTYAALDPMYNLDPGETGDFGAKLRFDGSVSFEVEQIAIVPEPATLAVMLLGSGLLALRRRR